MMKKLSSILAIVLVLCSLFVLVPSAEEAAAIALALDQEMNGEVYAAIGMAMHQYLNDTVHDMESYIITIRRK